MACIIAIPLHIFLVATFLALAANLKFTTISFRSAKVRARYSWSACDTVLGSLMQKTFWQYTSSSKSFGGKYNIWFCWCIWVQKLVPAKLQPITSFENLTWMPAILVTTSKWHTDDSPEPHGPPAEKKTNFAKHFKTSTYLLTGAGYSELHEQNWMLPTDKEIFWKIPNAPSITCIETRCDLSLKFRFVKDFNLTQMLCNLC